MLTLHRPANVDTPESLATHPLAHPARRGGVSRSSSRSIRGPRVAWRRAASSSRDGSIRLVEPLGYLEFLALLDHAALVLTDSGGIQEETTVLGVPCFTLRDNTERPVTITQGTNTLVGADARRPRSGRSASSARAVDRQARIPELWDGHAGERIAGCAGRARPVNILFLSDNFPPERNASATRVYERACYWVKDGHRVTVITCAPNFPDGKVFPGYRNRGSVEERDGIRVVRVRTFISPNTGFFLRTVDFVSYMLAAVMAGLREEEPDLVAATSPQFFAAVGGWILSRLRRVPFVFELGDLWPASIEAVGASRNRWLIGFLERVELFLYRESAAVAALTHRFRDDLVRRGIPEERVRVVRNGVDLPRYAPRPRDATLARDWGLEGRFVVGYLGTHGMAHGLANVLDAAERLRGTDVTFLFVGAGAERRMLVDDAARRGLSNVVFVPAQEKAEMPRVWSLCDVALVHLKNDPVFETVIPSKIFEAMGMGLPILLVSPSGEAREIVEGDGAGLWVPAGAPDALARAVPRSAARRRPAAATRGCEPGRRAAPQPPPPGRRDARRVPVGPRGRLKSEADPLDVLNYNHFGTT